MKKNLLTIISFILFFFPSFHSQAQAGQWTWIKGVNGNSTNAVYGQQGIPANSNTPKACMKPVNGLISKVTSGFTAVGAMVSTQTSGDIISVAINGPG